MTTRSTIILPAILAGLVALGGAGTALAQTQTPGQTEQAEINHLQAATVSPVQAIKAAEQAVNGHALSYGYEVNGTTNAYEVTLATQSGLKIVHVDPTSGNVTGTQSAPDNALAGDGLPASAIQTAASAPVTLLQAVQAVGSHANGPVLEASYAVHNGNLGLDVDVAGSGQVQSYTVDAQTGNVKELSAAENEGQEGGPAAENGQDAD